jgi:predicted amidohydrolase
VQTATVNPAKIVKLEGRMEGLQVGDAADIVAFRLVDGAIEIESVYLDGEAVAAKAPL